MAALKINCCSRNRCSDMLAYCRQLVSDESANNLLNLTHSKLSKVTMNFTQLEVDRMAEYQERLSAEYQVNINRDIN